jgi:hypothetical protein
LIAGTFSFVHTRACLARKIGPGCLKRRIIEGALAERYWSVHHHVGLSHGGEADDGDGCREEHGFELKRYSCLTKYSVLLVW